ncbi:formylglycine-generating enzyme required for sulfatase activity [Bradyrhizobium sp. S3.2.6]
MIDGRFLARRQDERSFVCLGRIVRIMSLSEAGTWAVAERHADMLLVPGGMFRMGSDKHYPEEKPAHRVAVDSFRIDRTPVTNQQFRAFIEVTGYVTFAEIAPDPNDYPGALPHMLKAGSLVFNPPDHPVDLRDRNSSVGKLDKALDVAQAEGWTIVDMKNDWKRVFAFEGK